MIIDDDGMELLQRELPSWFERILRSRSSRFTRSRPGPSNFRPPQVTANLVAPNGEEYRLLFVRTRITVLGILAWPATQVAVLTLAVLAAVATSLLLARYLSLPIVRLQRATRALSAGAFETRVGKPFDQRKDEVGTLARDFDTMAERIQALVTDKEVLMRDVSHELRSPLARIRVALALAQLKANESAQADLTRIEKETERLDSLVGQILSWARLRSPSSELHGDVDLSALLSEVIANAEFEYPNTKIVFAKPPATRVRGNADELSSAVENVLRNALIHSGPDNEVEVQLIPGREQVELRILDRGPGIAEDDLDRIFEPFYRVDESRDHQNSGYGLGLAITASIVTRHGGHISARNRSGGGLEIVLQLPARQNGSS
jgi:two-component system sensor histidine kinase CpxA